MADNEWNHVSDRKLGPCDLPNVHRALTNIQYKWEFLAVQFGLSRRIIESARNKYPRDHNGCLMYVLEQWLEGNYVTQQLGHPSWRKVCEVTVEPAGGDNRALALKIATANVIFIEPQDSDKPTKRRQILSIFVGILLLFVILVLIYLSLPALLELYQEYHRDTHRQRGSTFKYDGKKFVRITSNGS